jgi:proline dehydrogenase
MAQLNFQNTEVAFASKDDKSLKKAYWLFKLVANPSLVKLGRICLNIAMTLRLPIKGIIKRTIFSQFVGGETGEEADASTDVLSKYGIGTILDYSVEGTESQEGFDQTTKEILKTVHISAGQEMVPFCVFKPSGIGRFSIWEKVNANKALSDSEKREFEETEKRANLICRTAHEAGTPVLIDAEESWIQDAADRMAEKMMERYNKSSAIVYTTLQMYRHDRLEYLKEVHARAKEKNFTLGVKIVRGAYMEKERDRAEEQGYRDPIQPNKAATDRDFDAAISYAVAHINDIALVAGTHNEKSSMLLTELMRKSTIDNNHSHVFFAQLYGMSDHISYNLSAAAYNVAKYVPYGPVKEVMPYLIRRAEENTSAAGQTGRELGLILSEMKRRKEQ